MSSSKGNFGNGTSCLQLTLAVPEGQKEIWRRELSSTASFSLQAKFRQDFNTSSLLRAFPAIASPHRNQKAIFM
jgi:hypothetical protein